MTQCPHCGGPWRRFEDNPYRYDGSVTWRLCDCRPGPPEPETIESADAVLAEYLASLPDDQKTPMGKE